MISGSLREPILKVMSLLKSMDFVSNFPIIATKGIMNDIGQMPHEFVSVFSFFLTEFKPYGRVGDATLVSPEATLLDMPKITGLLNGLTSLVKYGLSDCQGGWGFRYCAETQYRTSKLGELNFNKTSSQTEFTFDTFEGPSLVGGLDNNWVGSYFGPHNGKATSNPIGYGHVLHFPTASWNGDFYSPIIHNADSDGNAYVVKFRYMSDINRAGGCIGYVDASRSYLNSQQWALCDDWSNGLVSNGNWIQCQFLVPTEIENFHIVVGDRSSPGGDAYFDDIQLASGTETTCTGVLVPKKDPPGQLNYANAVVDRLATLLTAGRLEAKSREIIVHAFNEAGSANDGLRLAQELILTSAEYHTTSITKTTTQLRNEFNFPPSTGKSYRAVIYLMLSGGCDSFNLITPHTCSNGLFESYLGKLKSAKNQDKLLSIFQHLESFDHFYSISFIQTCANKLPLQRIDFFQ